jgi:HK97 family phage major capsid protein
VSNALIKDLQARRLNVWEQAKALNESTIAETRADASFSGEEQASWDRLNGELEQLDQRIAALTDAEARSAAIPEAVGHVPAAAPEGRSVADEFRAVYRGEKRGFDVTAPQGFWESRDLTKGSATAGGNTVPTSFYGRLVEHMIEVSGVMMAGPTILNTTSGESFDVPVTTAFSSGALTAEAAAISESDPAFAKRTLGAYKYAALMQVSRELLEDTGVDLSGFLARQAGRAVGNALGAHLATGTGSSQPAGIVTGASAGVTGATSVAGAFSADNLIDLQFSVIAPYRNSPSCAWMMRDATLAAVRKLKDTTNQYLWQPSMQVGTPDTLLGKPVYTDPNIAAVALSAKSVIFGDISAYFVRLAGGVRFERSDEFAFNTDLITFKAVVRGDGILADQTGAVKVFAGGAS